MPNRVYNVLFLCPGNSARSILAEAILNDQDKDRFRAFSAGSHPTGEVHSLALAVLEQNGLPTEGLRSKAWQEFAVPGAPRLDFIVSVCDNAAGEVNAVWPGQPAMAHWGQPDPAAVEGTELEKMNAFREAYRLLERRIGLFRAVPIATLDRHSVGKQLQAVAQGR